jgi:ADP-heptose:LPS heptosyltransferase
MELRVIVERNKIIKISVYFLINLLSRITRVICSWYTYDGNIVAIISIHKLGDTVFTIPAIREILGNYINNNIVIFCFPESRPIYKRAFPKLKAESIGHNEFRFSGRIAKRSGRRKLKKYKPHIIFDLTGTISSATLIFSIRSKEIVGINNEYFKKLYDIYSPIRKTPHIMDIYLDAIKQKIHIRGSDNIKTFPIKSTKNNSRLLFHPLAGWESKQWGMEKFVELILQLSEYDRTFVIAESGYSESVINDLSNDGVKIVESKTIEGLMEIIESHSVFIGNDSGPAHISSFLGIPTFIIYGPTNPIYHTPSGKYHEYIQKKIWCSPEANTKLCYTDGGRKGCPSFECMKQLTVEEVKDKLLDFLNKIEISQNKG